MRNGPLSGVTIIEIASIGPGPLCGMLLSDMGAEVIRVERKAANANAVETGMDPKFDFMARGRRSIALDLKQPEAVAACLKLIGQADALQEGFRPGVMERIGLGPDICLAQNPKLVYGRMTGWGQEGPLSQIAGHDVNYGSITGAIHAIGPQEGKPVPPLALVGDMGGGALYLALGMLAGIIEARASGKGQVVDAAMCDGVTSLATAMYGLVQAGVWDDAKRQANMVDGGAPFYDIYETKDGKYISIAAMEPAFYAQLREILSLSEPMWKEQWNRKHWPKMKNALAVIFVTRTQAEWSEIMGDKDVCFAPVLTFSEARHHPHNVARNTFVEIDGAYQPNAAPRFSRTKSKIQHGVSKPGEHTAEVLSAKGFSAGEIDALRRTGAI